MRVPRHLIIHPMYGWPFYAPLILSGVIWVTTLTFGIHKNFVQPLAYYMLSHMPIVSLHVLCFLKWLHRPDSALCYSCRRLFLTREKQAGVVGSSYALRTLAGLLLACGPVYQCARPGHVYPGQLLAALLGLVGEAFAFGEVFKHAHDEYYKFVVARIGVVACVAVDVFGPGALYTWIIVVASVAALFLHRCLPLYEEEGVMHVKIRDVPQRLRESVNRPLEPGRVYLCSNCGKRIVILVE